MKLFAATIRHLITTILTLKKVLFVDNNDCKFVTPDGVVYSKDGEEKDGCCGGDCHSEEKDCNC